MMALQDSKVKEESKSFNSLLTQVRLHDKIIFFLPIESNDQIVLNEILTHLKPVVLCLELTQSRFGLLQHSPEWEEMNILQVFPNGKWILLLTDLILLHFIRVLGLNRHECMGENLLTAIGMAQKKAIQVQLIDQETDTLAKRAWCSATKKHKLAIIKCILELLFTTKGLNSEERFYLKKTARANSLYTSILRLFYNKLPFLKSFLEDERLLFISEQLRACNGSVILAYLHPSHIQPIMNLLEKDPSPKEPLMVVPESKSNFKFGRWGIPFFILSLFAIGLLKSKTMALEMIGVWMLIHGAVTAFAALLVFAHPLTILACFVLSPITSFTPSFGAGFLLMIVESMIRKPRVRDLEYLSEDVRNWNLIFKNRIVRIGLVFIAISIASLSATFIGLTAITKFKIF